MDHAKHRARRRRESVGVSIAETRATNSAVIVRLAAFAKASAAERARGPAKRWRRRDRTIQYAAASVFISGAGAYWMPGPFGAKTRFALLAGMTTKNRG